MTQFRSDIDIDCADREQVMSRINATQASVRENWKVRRHASGAYITPIPYVPVHDVAAIDYKTAEERGYVKLDLLNVHVYGHVRDEAHLVELMREPNWKMLRDPDIVKRLVQIHSQYDIMRQMPEPINSIPRLAMFLAVIRPSKRHLIGKTWAEVAETIWDKTEDGYVFKKSHAIAYATLTVVNMNLYEENPTAFVLPE